MSDAMADAPPGRGGGIGRKAILGGIALAVLLGAGGFYAVWSGMILSPRDTGPGGAVESPAETGAIGSDLTADVAFVPLDAITITLPPGVGQRYLRFRAQLEVAPADRSEVEHLLPRVMDVLNSYLRAVEPAELTHPGALVRLRAQLRRRIDLVVGEGRVRDLLVMEFVLD